MLNGLQIISRGTSPPRLLVARPAEAGPASTNLLFREIHYDGKVSDTEARFAVTFEVESMTTNEISAPLFEGDVALAFAEPARRAADCQPGPANAALLHHSRASIAWSSS